MPFAVLLVVLAAFLFGSASPLRKSILSSVTPFQLAGLLYLGAALGVAPGVIFKKRFTPIWRIPRKSRGLLIGAIACGGLLGPLPLLFGLKIGQASTVSLWLNLELVFTALLGHWLFHDHLHRTGWIALSGIVAAALMLTGGGGRGAVGSGLLVALACLMWGFDNHFTALIDGITAAESTFWKGLAAGSVNLGIGLASGPYIASWQTTGAALLVGVFCYGISIVFYITSAQKLGATRSHMFFSTAPFFGLTSQLPAKSKFQAYAFNTAGQVAGRRQRRQVARRRRRAGAQRRASRIAPDRPTGRHQPRERVQGGAGALWRRSPRHTDGDE